MKWASQTQESLKMLKRAISSLICIGLDRKCALFPLTSSCSQTPSACERRSPIKGEYTEKLKVTPPMMKGAEICLKRARSRERALGRTALPLSAGGGWVGGVGGLGGVNSWPRSEAVGGHA